MNETELKAVETAAPTVIPILIAGIQTLAGYIERASKSPAEQHAAIAQEAAAAMAEWQTKAVGLAAELAENDSEIDAATKG